MLKLGLRFEEELSFSFQDKEIKLKIERNGINWVKVLIDAPKDVVVLRESARDRDVKIIKNNAAKVLSDSMVSNGI